MSDDTTAPAAPTPPAAPLCLTCNHDLRVHRPHPSARAGRGTCEVPGCPGTRPTDPDGRPYRPTTTPVRLVVLTTGEPLAWSPDLPEDLPLELEPRTAYAPTQHLSALGAVIVGQLHVRTLGEDVTLSEDDEPPPKGWFTALEPEESEESGACPGDPAAARRRKLVDTDPGAAAHLHGRASTPKWYPEQTHALAARIDLLAGADFASPWASLATDLRRVRPAGHPDTSPTEALTAVLFALDRLVTEVEDLHRGTR